MKNILEPNIQWLRKFVNEGTPTSKFLKQQYDRLRWLRSRVEKKDSGFNYVIFWSGTQTENRTGIYLNEGCDLPAVFACVPMIKKVLNGTCCLFRNPKQGAFRSDLILQTLQNYPSELVKPVTKKLKLPSNYFHSDFFDPNFTVSGINGKEEFPKTVVIMTIGRDYNRTVYRHREHGFLVDPGGWWLNQSIDSVLGDLSTAKWFRENFVSLGKMSVDDFVENFGKVVKLLKQKTNAHVLVFNHLNLDPGNLTHNYQLVKNSQLVRRMELNLALVELSRQLDFSIIDVDRILKKAGIGDMLDFAHFPVDLYQPIAREVFRILRDLEVF